MVVMRNEDDSFVLSILHHLHLPLLVVGLLHLLLLLLQPPPASLHSPPKPKTNTIIKRPRENKYLNYC